MIIGKKHFIASINCWQKSNSCLKKVKNYYYLSLSVFYEVYIYICSYLNDINSNSFMI